MNAAGPTTTRYKKRQQINNINQTNNLQDGFFFDAMVMCQQRVGSP